MFKSETGKIRTIVKKYTILNNDKLCRKWENSCLPCQWEKTSWQMIKGKKSWDSVMLKSHQRKLNSTDKPKRKENVFSYLIIKMLNLYLSKFTANIITKNIVLVNSQKYICY